MVDPDHSKDPQSDSTSVRPRRRRYSYGQSLLDAWIDRNADAAELSQTAPLLLWLLIARHQNSPWPEAHVEMLLKSSRTKILSAACGIAQKSALKWLSRIHLVEGSDTEHRLLVNGLRAELFRTRWAQEHRIPLHWIRGALGFLEVAHSRAFFALCKQYPQTESDFWNALEKQARFWRDALEVARDINIPDAEVALNRCADFTAVRRLHDRWTNRLNQRKAQVVVGATAFPSAPVAGTDTIHPILSLEDLQAEGRLMHHCVSVYESRILQGDSYVYRMLSPERATIELVIRGNSLRIGQLSLAYNALPRQSTLEAANRWLLGACR